MYEQGKKDCTEANNDDELKQSRRTPHAGMSESQEATQETREGYTALESKNKNGWNGLCNVDWYVSSSNRCGVLCACVSGI